MSLKVCNIPECPGRVVCRGMCPSHWAKWYRYGNPLAGWQKNRFILQEKTAVIVMKDGARTTIGLRDLELAKKHTWSLHCGYIRSSRKIGGKVKQVLLHRLIMQCPEGKQVDHINGKRTDNRRCNLRIVDASGNGQNKDTPNGKYRGVYRLGAGWLVCVYTKGKRHQKWFSDREEARKHAVRMRRKMMKHTNEERVASSKKGQK